MQSVRICCATNGTSQATFKCQSCRHEDHSDVNAAKNISAAGHAVLAWGEEIRPTLSKAEEASFDGSGTILKSACCIDLRESSSFKGERKSNEYYSSQNLQE